MGRYCDKWAEVWNALTESEQRAIIRMCHENTVGPVTVADVTLYCPGEDPDLTVPTVYHEMGHFLQFLENPTYWRNLIDSTYSTGTAAYSQKARDFEEDAWLKAVAMMREDGLPWTVKDRDFACRCLMTYNAVPYSIREIPCSQ